MSAPVVGPGELAAALGLTRSSFMRAVLRGYISPPDGTPARLAAVGSVAPRVPLPAPAGRTRGRWRQWTAAQLPELVKMLRALGRGVPEGWEPVCSTCAGARFLTNEHGEPHDCPACNGRGVGK